MDLNGAKEIYRKKDKVFYRKGDTLIKLFDESYPKADVLNEALNQARVEETSLRVPRVEEVTRTDGKWAIVMEYIEGETLAALMEAHPEKEAEYLDFFVDLQLTIGAQRVRRLPRFKDKAAEKIDASEYSEAVKYDLHSRLDGLPRHYKLCHGDFCPGNIVLTEEGVPYIIDWAHATQGNAAADAARTYLIFRLAGEDSRAEAYLRLYCRKSGTARGYVENILPVVAAAQTAKSTEEEKTLLRKWTEVVDWL